jgi:hypothetical protein
MTTSHEDRLAGSSRLTANGRRKPLGMNSLTCQYGAKRGWGTYKEEVASSIGYRPPPNPRVRKGLLLLINSTLPCAGA